MNGRMHALQKLRGLKKTKGILEWLWIMGLTKNTKNILKWVLRKTKEMNRNEINEYISYARIKTMNEWMNALRNG